MKLTQTLFALSDAFTLGEIHHDPLEGMTWQR